MINPATILKNLIRHEYLLRFFVIVFSLLIVAIVFSYKYFPQKNPALWDYISQLDRDEEGWLKRLFDFGRRLSANEQMWRALKQSGPKVKSWKQYDRSATSDISGSMDPRHVALRETALAQSILFDRYQINEKVALSVLKLAQGPEAFRDYEEERFLNEILWLKYQDHESNKEILHELTQNAIRLLDDSSAFFEDYLSAGVACLLSGRAAEARRYLEKALKDWPAKGRARGNVYLALMITHAAEGNSRRVMTMLRDFQENYPDWLYVETFIPDLKDLLLVYPHAPLLKVVYGRLLRNVNDYASALDEFRGALTTDKLDPIVTITVKGWIREMEQERL